MTWLRKIPVVWVAASALGGAALFGGMATRTVGAQMQLPERVTKLEQRVAAMDSAARQQSELLRGLATLTCMAEPQQGTLAGLPCRALLGPER